MRTDGRGNRCTSASGLVARLVLLLTTCMAMPCVAAADLQTRVERAIAEEGITGAVWAIDDGTSVRSGAAGLAAQGRPMRADARVHVGSIAKALLATAEARHAGSMG